MEDEKVSYHLCSIGEFGTGAGEFRIRAEIRFYCSARRDKPTGYYADCQMIWRASPNQYQTMFEWPSASLFLEGGKRYSAKKMAELRAGIQSDARFVGMIERLRESAPELLDAKQLSDAVGAR